MIHLPFDDPRPVPRPANLGARETDRRDEWREKYNIFEEVAALDAKPSIISRLTDWYDRWSSDPVAWKVLIAVGVIAVAIAAWVAL